MNIIEDEGGGDIEDEGGNNILDESIIPPPFAYVLRRV